ncbi:putative cardiolipin synthase YwiE [Rubripirellula lacrimiformis]|uniref:Cardiolipin synthase n=1 Tax=Rubripirellula lacrimiformis TaxID=1930273 RepID=A0A517N7H4_9BACT|nr:cardiolipin synthase [Rubripirellula lacrimiformis]QDT03082.1 putative cardiolipin synthase YwiE [Rubripirellula lacrimiformis]
MLPKDDVTPSRWSFLWRAVHWPGEIRDWILHALLFPFWFLCRKNERIRRFAAWLRFRRRRLTAVFLLVAHLLGAAASLNVLTEQRTPQGAIAWIVSLNTFPYLAVPMYWLVGETDYGEHAIAYRASTSKGQPIVARLYRDLQKANLIVPDRTDTHRLVTRLVKLPVTRGNEAKLLIDGPATFDAMMNSIESAKSYVLVEFYIVRDDQIGRSLQELLIKKSKQGVRVSMLYDEYGSRDLPNRYVEELRAAGVQVRGFNSPMSDGSTTRLNFRNHRKLVIVDGETAFVGGHNVGDEYRYGVGELGLYRDTHVQVDGPLVQCCQVVFAEDWHAVTDELLTHLHWQPTVTAEPGVEAVCVPTGPADEFETASMFFMQLIHSAKERVWIATPYFVPDEQMVTTLKLAALRGVDVRILIPEKSDATLVWLSSFSYLEELDAAGVRVYRYQDRFMHQKVMLVDDSVAVIGTANFDNRSFRLNFELMLAFFDEKFVKEVARMLESDLRDCKLADSQELAESTYAFQTLVRASRLLAPIQ